MFKLPKKVKVIWLKALRSGKYTQTTDGYLYANGGHCCLGVARSCGLVRESRASHITDSYGHLSYVQESFMPLDNQRELSQMNDSGVSFLDIANYIEKKF